MYKEVFFSNKNNSVLSNNTTIVKSIQTVELFQLFQIIIIQDTTNFCSFKNENIFRTFTTTTKNCKFQAFFPSSATAITRCCKKKKNQIRCRKRRRRKRQLVFLNPNLKYSLYFFLNLILLFHSNRQSN